MTLQTPPSWLQAGSYPAQYDRLTQQALYATTGIIGNSSLAVTANSPAGMSVLVASGWAAIVGTTTTNMGVYTLFNDAQETLTITTADATNPRIDLVCATVRDAFYSGANNDVIFQVIAGTPAGSPVAPALPANSISLATVAVAAGATVINSGDITDTRVEVTTNLPSAGMTSLATGSLSGASVTISAISSGYKNLQLVIRNWKPATDDATIRLRFNGDTNTRYQAAQYSPGYSNQSFGSTSLDMLGYNDNSVATGLIIMDIPDYANTTTWKYVLSNALTVNATTTTNLNFAPRIGFYNQTGAISSITLFPDSGNFTSGDYILYGVS
jgi:hypothetical protein